LLYAGKKGSHYGKPCATNPSKLEVELSPEQTDILIGTLLGAACIERSKSTHNSRVRFDQSGLAPERTEATHLKFYKIPKKG